MPEKIDTSRSMPFRFATKRSDFVLWKNGPIWPLCRLVGRITKVIFENNKLFWFLGHFCSLGAWTLTKHIFFLFSEWRMIFLRPWESFQLLQPAKFFPWTLLTFKNLPLFPLIHISKLINWGNHGMIMMDFNARNKMFIQTDPLWSINVELIWSLDPQGRSGKFLRINFMWDGGKKIKE